MLDAEIVDQIPKSTLHNWKKRDFNKLFGTDKVIFSEEKIEIIKTIVDSKKLFAVIRAVFRVNNTLQQLFDQAKNKTRIFRDSRKQIVGTIDRVKQCVGIRHATSLLGISVQQFYSWKRMLQCTRKNALVCNKQFPQQITVAEIEHVKNFLKLPDILHWPLASVYYKMIRERAAIMSLTSFYKYARLLGLKRSKPNHKWKLKRIGIKATKAGQTLHMDVTIFKTLDNTKVFLYFLVDNFSRFILGWRASLQYSSAITFDLMSEVYEKYRLEQLKPVVDLIVDGGSENKGFLNTYLGQPHVHINKLIAQKDIVFSNSMVEAVNKQMKYSYLFTRDLPGFQQTVQFLRTFAIEDYNNKPHYALYGLTPKEVFNGKQPDKAALHKKIADAGRQRLQNNAGFDCEDCEEMEA
jgi:hypothetical protein